MVKILFILLILFMLPELVRGKPKKKKNRSLEKTYNSKLMGCETSRDCGDMILEESMNCVTHCVSPVCHKEIQYDINPLEDGEVDEGRAIAFAQCVKNEILKERADARKN